VVGRYRDECPAPVGFARSRRQLRHQGGRQAESKVDQGLRNRLTDLAWVWKFPVAPLLADRLPVARWKVARWKVALSMDAPLMDG
jgi:hypothetical protein